MKITINDNQGLWNLKVNDWVEYNGNKYVVISIQDSMNTDGSRTKQYKLSRLETPIWFNNNSNESTSCFNFESEEELSEELRQEFLRLLE